MTVATAVPRPPDPERGLDAREPIPRLLRDLRTSARGLSSHEAAHRLEQFGPRIAQEAPAGGRARSWPPFTHPFAMVLLLVALLAGVAGMPSPAGAIRAVVVLSAEFANHPHLAAASARSYR
jgi:Cation transporter/ATPase, N-terminus